jgi:NTP pyrophosphatase (non-canonical NTP hydrolase)
MPALWAEYVGENRVNNRQWVFDRINEERDRQDTKWGENRDLPNDTWLRVLVEEVGEVARAIHDCPKIGSAEVIEKHKIHLAEELIQSAAVIVAWLEPYASQYFGIDEDE